MRKWAKLDTFVTVVDAYNFYQDFSSIDTVQTRHLNNDPLDNRPIVNLLIDQIEFASVIVLNKIDLVSPYQVGELKAILQKLNPEAKIIETSFGKVPLSEVMNTGLYDYEKATSAAGWIRELEKGYHTPETEEYGISSFVFRDRRPFHPERFWLYTQQYWHANILRSKGLFWIATRPHQAINWSQAGGSLRAEPAGMWWVSMPMSQRVRYQEFLENKENIKSRWDDEFGDRMNEIVIIGQDLNEDQIREELEECLCSLEEWNDIKKGKF